MEVMLFHESNMPNNQPNPALRKSLYNSSEDDKTVTENKIKWQQDTDLSLLWEFFSKLYAQVLK